VPTVISKNTEHNQASEATPSAPHRYTRLDGQYVAGIWRHGPEGSTLTDSDPLTGEPLAEIVQANEKGAYPFSANALFQKHKEVSQR
jgi:hypothetical protein